MNEDVVSLVIEDSHQGMKNRIVLMSHDKEGVFALSRIGESRHWYTTLPMPTTHEVYIRLPRQ